MTSSSIFKPSNPSLLDNKPGEYPSPFLDIASFMMPSSMKETLDLCTAFWMKHGLYRNAAQRVVRYFITEPEFTQDEDSRLELTQFLEKDFKLTQTAACIGDDLLSCGLTASSLVYPFNRYLRCPECNAEHFIDNVSWRWKKGGFHASCSSSSCNFHGEMKVVDRKSLDRDRIHLQRWNPYDIFIKQHPYSKRTEIFWDIPQDIRSQIKAGDPFMVRDMPLSMLQTVRDDKVLQFASNFAHLETEQSIASVDLKGWGLPRLMANFAQAYYIQMIKKANEAMAKDYMVPFRLISPTSTPVNTQGPWMNQLDTELVNEQARTMVANHRKNPTSFNFSPVPMQYQSMGGEGQMVSPELLTQGINELLVAIGVPPAFFTGELTMQAAPMALRVLQQSWPTMQSSLNSWLEFIVSGVCRYMNWETPEDISFREVKTADDIERRHLLLQLASSGMISKRTAFGAWGIDPQEEQGQILNEMRSEQTRQKDFEEELREMAELEGALSGMGGMMAPGMGGAPGMAAPVGGPVSPTAAGQAPLTVSDRNDQVNELAQQLVSMPYAERRRMMSDIKASDQELHALVKARMEDIRTDAEAQGRAGLEQGGSMGAPQ